MSLAIALKNNKAVPSCKTSELLDIEGHDDVVAPINALKTLQNKIAEKPNISAEAFEFAVASNTYLESMDVVAEVLGLEDVSTESVLNALKEADIDDLEVVASLLKDLELNTPEDMSIEELNALFKIAMVDDDEISTEPSVEDYAKIEQLFVQLSVDQDAISTETLLSFAATTDSLSVFGEFGNSDVATEGVMKAVQGAAKGLMEVFETFIKKWRGKFSGQANKAIKAGLKGAKPYPKNPYKRANNVLDVSIDHAINKHSATQIDKIMSAATLRDKAASVASAGKELKAGIARADSRYKVDANRLFIESKRADEIHRELLDFSVFLKSGTKITWKDLPKTVKDSIKDTVQPNSLKQVSDDFVVVIDDTILNQLNTSMMRADHLSKLKKAMSQGKLDSAAKNLTEKYWYKNAMNDTTAAIKELAHASGMREGARKAFAEADKTVAAARASGKSAGLKEGFAEGSRKGFDAGKSAGSRAGFKAGVEIGKTEGLLKGALGGGSIGVAAVALALITPRSNYLSYDDFTGGIARIEYLGTVLNKMTSIRISGSTEDDQMDGIVKFLSSERSKFEKLGLNVSDAGKLSFDGKSVLSEQKGVPPMAIGWSGEKVESSVKAFNKILNAYSEDRLAELSDKFADNLESNKSIATEKVVNTLSSIFKKLLTAIAYYVQVCRTTLDKLNVERA